MSSYANAARLITLVACDLWRELLEEGCLNDHGIEYLRSRLSLPGEFEANYPGVQLLRLDLDLEYARVIGVDESDLPAALQVPDSPGDLG